jgi:hypothetical protein
VAVPGEARHLAEVGEELLHLAHHPVEIPALPHERIVAMGRLKLLARAAGACAAFCLYVWFAAVRNREEVLRRKARRRSQGPR